MRRKEPPITAAGRGKSLIATRTSQHQQRKPQAAARSQLPRSYSSPSQHEESQSPQKTYVMRSFSSPEPKNLDYRRNSDSFYSPKTYGSRTELDSDFENFEQFKEGFLDIDVDQEVMFTPYRSQEREEPRRVMTTLLPGSGLQRATIRPISSTTQTLQGARDAMKQLHKKEDDKASRLHLRPLMLTMPTRLQDPSPADELSELSPQLDLESSELEMVFEGGEQHLARGVAMATEESDADTLSMDPDWAQQYERQEDILGKI